MNKEELQNKIGFRWGENYSDYECWQFIKGAIGEVVDEIKKELLTETHYSKQILGELEEDYSKF